MNIKKETYNLLKSKLSSLGFDLINATLNRKEEVLAIVIDKDGFISLDELSKVSELISNLLEGGEYSTDYFGLDVTTLGVEKEIALDKLSKYINQYVSIRLSKAIQKHDALKGEIKKVESKIVTLEVNEKGKFKKIEVPFDAISKINLAIRF